MWFRKPEGATFLVGLDSQSSVLNIRFTKVAKHTRQRLRLWDPDCSGDNSSSRPQQTFAVPPQPHACYWCPAYSPWNSNPNCKLRLTAQDGISKAEDCKENVCRNSPHLTLAKSASQYHISPSLNPKHRPWQMPVPEIQAYTGNNCNASQGAHTAPFQKPDSENSIVGCCYLPG